MRLLRLASATLLVALSVACAATASATTIIGPGQTFALGGEQPQPVRVEGRNTGPVAVDLLSRRGQEPPVALLRAEPGQLFSVTLPAGHTALARNTASNRTARVQFQFNGQIDRLSMRYEAAASAPR
jgi:hypothetical protein